jgi:hypothetical protein
MFGFILPQSTKAQNFVANHLCTDISQIPSNWIDSAKSKLHILYGHTSHGGQIVAGMNQLDSFMGGTGLYTYNSEGTDSALDLRADEPMTAGDLGSPDRYEWVKATRTYLGSHSDINVVIWSWCGQVSYSTEEEINIYLDSMNQLEQDYPDIAFIYMTGHLDGTGLVQDSIHDANLHFRNEQIRNYCSANNKWLFDFTDIESYDPDGVYYGDKHPTDACNYDANNDGVTNEEEIDPAYATPIAPDSNWALKWQAAHPGSWYECSTNTTYHSPPLNANLKAYAAWWLWARLAGWDGASGVEKQREKIPQLFNISQNYPNPFNRTTTINYQLPVNSHITLKIYDQLGREIKTLVNGIQTAGKYSIQWNGKNSSGQDVGSGIYFYRLRTSKGFADTGKMILLD